MLQSYTVLLSVWQSIAAPKSLRTSERKWGFTLGNQKDNKDGAAIHPSTIPPLWLILVHFFTNLETDSWPEVWIVTVEARIIACFFDNSLESGLFHTSFLFYGFLSFTFLQKIYILLFLVYRNLHINLRVIFINFPKILVGNFGIYTTENFFNMISSRPRLYKFRNTLIYRIHIKYDDPGMIAIVHSGPKRTLSYPIIKVQLFLF